MKHEYMNELFMIIDIKTQLGRWHTLNALLIKMEEE